MVSPLTLLKALSLLVIVVLVGSLVLSAMGRIPWSWFWIVAVVAAFVAYVLMPRLKRRL
jgi:hypothetical protein